jgi:hypothetical protein
MNMRRWISALAAVAGLAGGGRADLHAQGVTTGAVTGVVTEAATGQPVEDAQIQVVNQSTGASTGGQTRADGRYNVAGLEVGGPYSVTVRRIGFQPQTREGFRVTLGQRVQADFALQTQAAVLSAVEVTAEQESPTFTRSRTGAATNISDSALRRLPTLNRNFTDFVTLTPQASTSGPGLSGGGVNNRFNNIQIDGASENDLFGLGSTGQPGGQAQGKSIGIESVREYQVLLAPFDVRQGNFAGLLVNAVTKSGTNRFSGSVYGFTRNENLARDTSFIREYDQTQYGFSLGGPILRDRIHFFVNPEFQTRTTPAAGPALGLDEPRLPVSEADITAFSQALESKGLTAGSAGQVNNANPLTNVFGRLDFQLPGLNSRFVLRHNYGRAEDDNFSRSIAQSNPTFGLSSTGYFFESTKNATVGQFYTTFANGANNELFVGYNTIRDRRTPTVMQPLVSVRVPSAIGSGSATLQAGSEQFSQQNELDQDIFEVTDNFTFPLGTHQITLGTKNEFYSIRNLFYESSFGVWTFPSLDAFLRDSADTYRVSRPLADPTGGSASDVEARFDAAQYGVYAQDQWQVTPAFSLTAGLRLDVPVFRSRPPTSAVVQEVFGRDTRNVPSANIHWSPRLGFNWDLSTPERRTQVRGGVGIFTGRPAFVWVGNAYQNNGSGVGILNCGGSSRVGPAPSFVSDISQQPTACANGQGLQTGVVGPVNLLDEDLMFPQTGRFSLGFDHELPRGFVFTFDALYTSGLNNFFYINQNLGNPTGVDRDGRVLYGAFQPSGVSTPNVVDARFSEAIDVTNQSRDYSYNVTGQLQKRFTAGLEVAASYTYSQAKDVQSLTSSRAISNWRFGRTLSGNHLDRGVSTSLFETPHRVVLNGTYSFPWERFATDASVIYIGQSGSPYDYVYGGFGGRGDLNADGSQGNDLVYIPRDARDPNEIRFTRYNTSATAPTEAEQIVEQQIALESFINGSPCLREQRGRIMERNSCRNPWQNTVNVALRQSLPAISGQSVQLELQVFNFLNLLNNEWGRQQFAGGNSNVNLLTHASQTTDAQGQSQGVFQFSPTTQKYNALNLASFYQIQLGARYSF